MCKTTLQVLDNDEAYLFMVGFTQFTPAEKNIVIYFLAHDLVFKGTYRDLSKDMGYNESYYAEIHRACHSLENAKILEIYQPNKGYIRTIKMVKNWIEIIIQIGKGHDKCCQNQNSQTPLINWEITR